VVGPPARRTIATEAAGRGRATVTALRGCRMEGIAMQERRGRLMEATAMEEHRDAPVALPLVATVVPARTVPRTPIRGRGAARAEEEGVGIRERVGCSA
jgi:hypothetical protein